MRFSAAYWAGCLVVVPTAGHAEKSTSLSADTQRSQTMLSFHVKESKPQHSSRRGPSSQARASPSRTVWIRCFRREQPLFVRQVKLTTHSRPRGAPSARCCGVIHSRSSEINRGCEEVKFGVVGHERETEAIDSVTSSVLTWKGSECEICGAR